MSNCVPDPDNVEKLRLGNATHLTCRCTHLTFFDVGWSEFIPEFNTITARDFRELTV